MPSLIYIIDDERDIQEIITLNLDREGYATQAFSSAEEAMEGLKGAVPNLIILDIMMSGMDGYDFCRYLRSQNEYREIPVIFLSAKSDEFDRVLGLELGADDYLTKPFSVKELAARVKAVLRRCEKSEKSIEQTGAEKFVFDGLELYPDSYRVYVDGEEASLTKTEFYILRLFMENRGKVFSRDNIIDSIKGTDVYVIDRTIDVHIMNLRKKLGPYKPHIKTFSGVGYGFRE